MVLCVSQLSLTLMVLFRVARQLTGGGDILEEEGHEVWDI